MKILLIRGGALGDFIVTLPTLDALRRKWPDAHIELLGHPHLAEVALHRRYLDATRSVNHGPLSAFFMPRAVLDPAWMDYIGTFDLVLSYFYDPDELFAANLTRCEPGRLIALSPRVPDHWNQPASRYFARILEALELAPGEDPASELHLLPGDVEAAHAFLTGLEPGRRLVAIHPGSGSETKNWPADSWAEIGRRLCQHDPKITLLLVEGEADAEPAKLLLETWKDLPHLRARWLPLPILAALLRKTSLFLGHDSGITHLAAAARRDLPIVALFGPSNSAVWAPPRAGVHVLQSDFGIAGIKVDQVFAAAIKGLSSKGLSSSRDSAKPKP